LWAVIDASKEATILAMTCPHFQHLTAGYCICGLVSSAVMKANIADRNIKFRESKFRLTSPVIQNLTMSALLMCFSLHSVRVETMAKLAKVRTLLDVAELLISNGGFIAIFLISAAVLFEAIVRYRREKN
jgi:hypothetical protein